MNNKILVSVLIPNLNRTFEIFIPVNEYVYNVTKLICDDINNVLGSAYIDKNKKSIMNKKTLNIYKKNLIIRDTDIKNSTELVLL